MRIWWKESTNGDLPAMTGKKTKFAYKKNIFLHLHMQFFLHFQALSWRARLHNAGSARFASAHAEAFEEGSFGTTISIGSQTFTAIWKKISFQLFNWSNKAKLQSPIFPDSVNVENEVIFSPKVYNMRPDKDILWQCPGYEYDSGI